MDQLLVIQSKIIFLLFLKLFLASNVLSDVKTMISILLVLDTLGKVLKTQNNFFFRLFTMSLSFEKLEYSNRCNFNPKNQ
ncbi:hypothetical protein MXB_1645 [Myxobolus squamalis]|nr:hypothetical protein MXB_1645 [Myxobolus squamalis]